MNGMSSGSDKLEVSDSARSGTSDPGNSSELDKSGPCSGGNVKDSSSVGGRTGEAKGPIGTVQRSPISSAAL